MARAIRSMVFAAILLVGIPALCQDPQKIPSIFGKFTPEQLNAINESRRLAQEELNRQSAAFKTPDIAIALEAHFYLIAIAKIISVQLPDASIPKTIVGFHVEQLIRGDGAVADFEVQSQWTPAPPSQSDVLFTVASNYRPTALDLSEPKVGDRFILGFTLAYKSGRFVFVPGVIDLQDPSQAELIGSMQRFLTIDSSAERAGFAPYLAALDDKAPWIRDIAVHRLTSSESCNASPICTGRFSEVVARQIRSDTPNERQQAVDWLIWVDSVSRSGPRKGHVDGLPILRDSKLRALFNEAIEDPNVSIGDMAFQYREEFDFYRTRSPGDCFAIVPSLRKSAEYSSGDANPVPALFPLSYTYGCISPNDSLH